MATSGAEERILALIRMQMEQERRGGIHYWCHPALGSALRDALERSAAGAPASTRRPAAGPGSGEHPAQGPAHGYARPPARLMPQSPRQAPAQSSAGRSGAARQESAARPKWGPPPAATGREPQWKEALDALAEHARECTSCPLHEGRNAVVFGMGEASVPLVFVGEAPGAEEDRQGLPFVGRAGELLTRIIDAIGLKRDQVYICNVLKCRPPGNRDPHPDEVVTCSPFLMRQLELLRPKVICTLGRHSTLLLTGQSQPMKAVRGQIFPWRGAKVIPTYHPAALLRNPGLKPMVWEDVQKVRASLDAE